ncbi:MAG: hypothetical protein QXM75_03025 [Candidatus Diapherotrites archaeon]
MDTFKLLISTVVALVIIFLLLQIFGFFEKPINTEKEIKDMLSVAEVNLGRYNSKVLPLEGTIFMSIFESDKRAVAPMCNNPALCCEINQSCPKVLEWRTEGTAMYVKTKQKKVTTVSTRCRFEKIHICRIYFGQEPAQVAIESLELLPHQEKIFSGDTIKINYSIKNTGATSMIVTPVVKLYSFHSDLSSSEDWLLIRNYFGKDIAMLKGEIESGSIELSINSPGRYKIELFAFERYDETNFATQSFEITIFGKST